MSPLTAVTYVSTVRTGPGQCPLSIPSLALAEDTWQVFTDCMWRCTQPHSKEPCVRTVGCMSASAHKTQTAARARSHRHTQGCPLCKIHECQHPGDPCEQRTSPLDKWWHAGSAGSPPKSHTEQVCTGAESCLTENRIPRVARPSLSPLFSNPTPTPGLLFPLL